MGLHTPDRRIIEGAFAAQERSEALMLVGESGGFPVAQAWIDFAERGTSDRPYLWAVRVFPPLQGSGLGRALMQAAERHAAAAGAHEIELGVEPENPGARRFYEGLGYRPAGSREEVVRHGPGGEVVRFDPHQIVLRKPLLQERPAARC